MLGRLSGPWRVKEIFLSHTVTEREFVDHKYTSPPRGYNLKCHPAAKWKMLSPPHTNQTDLKGHLDQPTPTI